MNNRQSALVILPSALAAVAIAPALAVGGNGLSVSPPLIEHTAVPGKIGAVTIANGTGQQLKISVATHPWIQSLSGNSVPDQRASLGTVRPSIGSFTLANGASRVVSVSLLRAPKGGSLYGNLDVIGVPAASRAPNAVTIGYRLVASLRLDPLRPRRSLSAGAAAVRGGHGHGTVVLAVRNSGNTIEPIGGSVRISGARGAVTGAISAIRILPGRTVDLPVYTLSGSLPAGGYSLSASLSEGGHRLLVAKRGFKIR